jgi:WD40 repeat protein
MTRMTLCSWLAVGSFALGCADEAPNAPSAPGPDFAISDAVHAAGTPHFFFLPPLVPLPAFTGTFDASVAPFVTVQICAWMGTECAMPLVAAFTTTSGPGTERIRVKIEEPGGDDDEENDEAAEDVDRYVVTWDTDEFELDLAQIYRIQVLVAGQELGYADVQLVRRRTELRNVNTGEFIGLVNGRKLRIQFRIENEAVWPITPAGGTVSAAGGAVRLEFPADAVTGTVGVTVAPASGLPGGEPPIAGTAFAFGPDGVQFAKSVRLSIRYDPAAVPAGVDQGSLRLHRLVGGAWVEVAGSIVNTTAKTVSGDITGFSVFSVLPARATPGAPGQIAFVSDRLGNNDIWLMDEDGGNSGNLTNHSADDRDPVWSPGGDRLAFVTNRDGNDEVYVMGAAGTPIVRVSNRTDPDDQPSWMPGAPGGDLVFTGHVLIPHPVLPDVFVDLPRIFVGQSGGGGVSRELVTSCTVCAPGEPFLLHREDDDPAGSPDGAHAALRFWTGDWLALRVVNTATGDVFADPGSLLAGRRQSYDVGTYTWSPTDPNTIAFEFVDRTNRGIYLADLTPDPPVTPVKLVDEPGFDLVDDRDLRRRRALVWSPDGKKLALVSLRDGNAEIYVLDMSVTPFVLTNLTMNAATDQSPTWSPAGDKIAFETQRHADVGDCSEIYVVSLASPGVATRLTNDPACDVSPRWRP